MNTERINVTLFKCPFDAVKSCKSWRNSDGGCLLPKSRETQSCPLKLTGKENIQPIKDEVKTWSYY
jgi:hypothetical protein